MARGLKEEAKEAKREVKTAGFPQDNGADTTQDSSRPSGINGGQGSSRVATTLDKKEKEKEMK